MKALPRKMKATIEEHRATTIVRLCEEAGISLPIAEWKFHPNRKWKLDLAFLAYRIGIEIDGGIWSKGEDGKTGGRHTRGAGWLKDQEKLNAAAIMGWRVLHYTPEQFAKDGWIEDVRQALKESS